MIVSFDDCEPATLKKDGYRFMRCEYDCGYFKSYEKIYSLKTIALSKTTYYVRLRTYKTLKDGKYYSSFSKTKVIKTK